MSPTLSNRPTCAIAIATLHDQHNNLVQRLSEEVVNYANKLPPVRRNQYLTGRWLLAELLFQQTGIAKLPDITTKNNGRPAFINPALPDFSISHSGDTIMVALAKQCRIGLDLEIRRPRKRVMALANYSFSELEYQWLNKLPPEQQECAFWQLWTIRESILKLAGKGVWQMKSLTIDPQQKRISTDLIPQVVTYSNQQVNLFWAISADNPLDSSAISFWQVDDDLRGLSMKTLPEFITLSTYNKEECDHLTNEALADIDVGDVIDHQTVQAWADSLDNNKLL